MTFSPPSILHFPLYTGSGGIVERLQIVDGRGRTAPFVYNLQ